MPTMGISASSMYTQAGRFPKMGNANPKRALDRVVSDLTQPLRGNNYEVFMRIFSAVPSF